MTVSITGLTFEKKVSGPVPNDAYCRFDGSGTYTAADFIITPADGLGFIPKRVKVTNLTDGKVTDAFINSDFGTSNVEGMQVTTNAEGFIPVPLNVLREASGMDVGAIAVNGGILASDTTPILEAINGDTDGCQRLNWAASNGDDVIFSIPLPPDFDPTADLVLHSRIASASTTDAVGFTVVTYFNEGDTAVSDTSGTNQTATYGEVVTTIAAADIPAGAQNITVQLTPVAHTTDKMYLTAVWFEYTKTNLHQVVSYAAHGITVATATTSVTIDVSVAGPITDNDDFTIEMWR